MQAIESAGKGDFNAYDLLLCSSFFYLTECSPNYYGALCNKRCPKCNHGTCFANNGTCDSGCKCNIIDELNAQGRC